MPIRKVPEEWFKEAVRHMPHPVACVAKNGKMIWANQAWCSLLDYPLAELVTMRWQDYTVLDDVGADMAAVEQVINGDVEEYTMRKTYIRRDRTHVPARLYVHRFPEVGEVVMFISCIEPVTHQEAEMQAIRKEVEDLKQIVNKNRETGLSVIRQQEDWNRLKIYVHRWWLHVAAVVGTAYVVYKEILLMMGKK